MGTPSSLGPGAVQPGPPQGAVGPRAAIVSHEAGAKIHIYPSLSRQRVDIVGIELQRSFQQSLGPL